jgi:hypothetical protein
MRFRKESSPWTRCAGVTDALLFFLRCVESAHLWRRMPPGHPCLCRERPAFSLMTTGIFSDILRTDEAVETAIGCVQEGRKDEKVVHSTITGRPIGRAVVCLLWGSLSHRSWLQKSLAAGIPAAIKCESWYPSVPVLPSAWDGNPHRCRSQRQGIGTHWAITAPNKLASRHFERAKCEGQGQARRLTLPSFWV